MTQTKTIYRVEIKSKFATDTVFMFWIGADLELVSTLDQAVACTHDEHVSVMEKIQIEATAYNETKGS